MAFVRVLLDYKYEGVFVARAIPVFVYGCFTKVSRVFKLSLYKEIYFGRHYLLKYQLNSYLASHVAISFFRAYVASIAMHSYSDSPRSAPYQQPMN